MNAYRQLFLNLTDAVLIEDTSGLILDANPAAGRLLRQAPEHLQGREVGTLMTPDSHQRLRARCAELVTSQHQRLDGQFVTAEGSIVSASIDVTPIVWIADSDDAEHSAFLIIAREKSPVIHPGSDSRIQRAAASHYGLPQAVFVLDKTDAVRRSLSGMDETFAERLQGLLSGDELAPVLDQAWNGQTLSLAPRWFRIEHAGATRPYWLKVSCMPVSGGAAASGITVQITDCTAERLEQEALRRKDQQVFLGLLTSALHHELNNYLAVVLAQASALRIALSQGQLPPPNVGAIMDATQQAAALLRRSAELLMSSEGQSTDVDLNAIAADCANVLEREFDSRIGITLELGTDIPKIRGDFSLLQTLVLSMARYAQTTLPQGSRITIGTYRSAVFYPGMPAAAGLAIKDHSADSLPARSNAKLRTVGPGSNEGFDYSLARSIVRYHRGEIETLNSSAQGNIWEITLPGLEERSRPAGIPAKTGARSDSDAAVHAQLIRAAANNTDALPGGPSVPGRGVRVLLADDEENFRIFTSWVLRENGYEVVNAADGQEAFERFQENPGSFSLVILDAYMPRLGGMETYLRMQVLRPDLPVLFASGFVRGASVDAMIGGCPGPASVILKPFTSEEMLAAVAKALAPKAEPELAE